MTVYIYKAQRIAYLKWEDFIVCQLHLIRAIKQTWQTFQEKIHICLPFFLLNLIELIYHSLLFVYFRHLSCISIDLLINKKSFIHLFPIYIDFFGIVVMSKNNYLAIHTEILIDEIWSLECVLILQEKNQVDV